MNKKFDKESEDIIFFAFRYCLGRMTGAVSMMVSYLINNWNTLSERTKDQIKHEIKEAIENTNAGMDCDVKQWNKILEL